MSEQKSEKKKAAVSWTQLLEQAVTQPGLILDAYSAFHNYSLGNQIAAAFQCQLRGLPIGPIDTFKGWLEKERPVKKGSKALSLCMPVTGKPKTLEVEVKDAATGEQKTEEVQVPGYRAFVWRPNWFVLAQTEGDAIEREEVPAVVWSKAAALDALQIAQVPFDHPNGNAQGYASGRSVAVSPLAKLPHKTLFHELAHVVLGHTKTEACSDGADLPRSLKEVEAEGVAYLIVETLQLPGAEYSRGYIQNWLQGEEIPETSARRIFSAADKIIKAGKPQEMAVAA